MPGPVERRKQQLADQLEAATKRREDKIRKHKKVPGVPMRDIHDGNLPTFAHVAMERDARRAALTPKPDRGAMLDAPHATDRAVAAGLVDDQSAPVGDFTRGVRGEHPHYKSLADCKATEAVSGRWGGGRFGPSQKVGQCDSHHFAAGGVPAWRPQGVAPPGSGPVGDYTGGIRGPLPHYASTYEIQAAGGVQSSTLVPAEQPGVPRRFHSHSCGNLVFPEVVHKSRVPDPRDGEPDQVGDYTRGFKSSSERMQLTSWQLGTVPKGGPLNGKRYNFAPVCYKNYKLTEWS